MHFSPDAIDAVFRVSGGTPRVINLVCDRALHRGHLARKSAIDLEAVTQAIDDLGVGELTAAPLSIVVARGCASPAHSPLRSLPPPVPSSVAAVATAAAGGSAFTRRCRKTAPSAAAPVEVGEASINDLSGLEVHDIEESNARSRQLRRPDVQQRVHLRSTSPAPTLAMARDALGRCRRRHARDCVLRAARRGCLHQLLPDGRRIRFPSAGCTTAAACPWRTHPFQFRQTSLNLLRRRSPRTSSARPADRLQVSRISGAEFRQAIRRGWSKHCPHCGRGALFIGWNKPHRTCPVMRLPIRTRLRRCVVGLDRDRPDTCRHRHRPAVFRISGKNLLDGGALFRFAFVSRCC